MFPSESVIIRSSTDNRVCGAVVADALMVFLPQVEICPSIALVVVVVVVVVIDRMFSVLCCMSGRKFVQERGQTH